MGRARLGQGHERADRRNVAERAGRLLHVRLELVDRGVEVPVAIGDKREQRLDRRLSPDRLGAVDEGVESLEDTGIARQEAGVDDRDEELGVVRLRLPELAQLAHLMTDIEAEVPERVQQRLDETFLGGGDRAPEQDQQVDVRVKTQVPSAIPADRQQRDRGLGL